MTFHTVEEVKELLSNFDIIKLVETDEMKKTATGEDKHWNFIDIIARKQTA